MARNRSRSQTLRDIAELKNLLAVSPEVVVAGDWHNDRTWIMNVFSRVRADAASLKVIFQLGDLEIGTDLFAKALLNFIDERCAGSGIAAVIVIPGNHDNRDRLESKDGWARGEMVPLSQFVWAAPPGLRLNVFGTGFLLFGSAASVQDNLVAGKNWWPQEVPDPAVFRASAAQGKATVLLAHEAVSDGPASVEAILSGKANARWRPERLAASRRSRDLITNLRNCVGADLTLHGHMHVSGETSAGVSPRVIALSDNRSPGNVGILGLPNLDFRWI